MLSESAPRTLTSKLWVQRSQSHSNPVTSTVAVMIPVPTMTQSFLEGTNAHLVDVIFLTNRVEHLHQVASPQFALADAATSTVLGAGIKKTFRSSFT